MAKKNLLSNGLVVPDLKNFAKIKDEFLRTEEQKAKIFARWELNSLWTKFRAMPVSDLFSLDTNPETTRLTVSELIVINQLKYIIRTDDMTELNKVYDRLLGKPKENKDEKVIDDVEFTIDILKNPNES